VPASNYDQLDFVTNLPSISCCRFVFIFLRLWIQEYAYIFIFFHFKIYYNRIWLFKWYSKQIHIVLGDPYHVTCMFGKQRDHSLSHPLCYSFAEAQASRRVSFQVQLFNIAAWCGWLTVPVTWHQCLSVIHITRLVSQRQQRVRCCWKSVAQCCCSLLVFPVRYPLYTAVTF